MIPIRGARANPRFGWTLAGHPTETPTTAPGVHASRDQQPMSKILIVDDSAILRKILMRVIRQAGVDTEGFLEASNGQEGLKSALVGLGK